jgi:Holliday junction resolvasome RuvABC ATP-dependent DNA helicase subunit
MTSQLNTLLMFQVLLLCGPPGLGKTTLAHVAAKHCGYHVMEVCVMVMPGSVFVVKDSCAMLSVPIFLF